MAQTKNRNNNTANRKPSNSNRNSSRKTTNTRSKQTKPVQVSNDEPGFADYWHEFSKTPFYKPVLTIGIIFVIILLDLLISWNTFERFFMILGIEILITAIIGVIKLALDVNSDGNKNGN